MLKPLIAGALALVFAIGAAPEQARADHGDRIVGGLVVGAILGATVAAITDKDRRGDRVYYDRGYRDRGYRDRSYRDRGYRDYRRPAPVYRRHYGPPPRVLQRRMVRRDIRDRRHDRRVARRELRRDRRVARHFDRRIDRLEDRAHRDDHRHRPIRRVYGEYRN